MWYVAQTLENGWSLSSLQDHIETKAYSRQVLSAKASNFAERLALPFSQLVNDTLKSPYVFGKDYYIDLLFYNTKLRCYVVI